MRVTSISCLLFVLLLPQACSHIQKTDAHPQMHAALLTRPRAIEIQDRDDDRVIWQKPAATAAKPLTGLRIALDPGHVGTSPWDERNGKYVTDSKQRLSEGVMALQLAHLLADELTHLGATVFVDRDGLAPVTARDYADFSENSGVFFQRLDLDARVERIWKFHPDLTLILHFDSHLDGDMNIEHAHDLCNDTKAYVPGAFSPDDLADNDERAFFNIIWRNPAVWTDSMELSSAIVQRIHTEMGIPLGAKGIGAALPVTDGVFARNLRLQRRLAGFVSAYLETLCYEDPAEFKRLAARDSRRLAQLSAAIRGGVLDFIKSRRSDQIRQSR